jgi:hypothetical protein
VIAFSAICHVIKRVIGNNSTVRKSDVCPATVFLEIVLEIIFINGETAKGCCCIMKERVLSRSSCFVVSWITKAAIGQMYPLISVRTQPDMEVELATTVIILKVPSDTILVHGDSSNIGTRTETALTGSSVKVAG